MTSQDGQTLCDLCGHPVTICKCSNSDRDKLKQLCQAMGLPQEWIDKLLNTPPNNTFENMLRLYRQRLDDFREDIMKRHMVMFDLECATRFQVCPRCGNIIEAAEWCPQCGWPKLLQTADVCRHFRLRTRYDLKVECLDPRCNAVFKLHPTKAHLVTVKANDILIRCPDVPESIRKATMLEISAEDCAKLTELVKQVESDPEVSKLVVKKQVTFDALDPWVFWAIRSDLLNQWPSHCTPLLLDNPKEVATPPKGWGWVEPTKEKPSVKQTQTVNLPSVDSEKVVSQPGIETMMNNVLEAHKEVTASICEDLACDDAEFKARLISKGKVAIADGKPADPAAMTKIREIPPGDFARESLRDLAKTVKYPSPARPMNKYQFVSHDLSQYDVTKSTEEGCCICGRKVGRCGHTAVMSKANKSPIALIPEPVKAFTKKTAEEMEKLVKVFTEKFDELAKEKPKHFQKADPVLDAEVEAALKLIEQYKASRHEEPGKSHLVYDKLEGSHQMGPFGDPVPCLLESITEAVAEFSKKGIKITDLALMMSHEIWDVLRTGKRALDFFMPYTLKDQLLVGKLGMFMGMEIWSDMLVPNHQSYLDSEDLIIWCKPTKEWWWLRGVWDEKLNDKAKAEFNRIQKS